MVMKVEPFHEALASLGVRNKKTVRRTVTAKKTRVIVTAASGKLFTHADAVRLSKYDRIVFLCGRYEGIDQRVMDRLADESLSIGPYVLTGGELPAMVMLDAIARHRPGVLGKEESLAEESWTDGAGEYPQYTRPEAYLGMKVPGVLLSGDHKKIKEWRGEH
jgi:tRNA (guanine37-N1)-methyltransferase